MWCIADLSDEYIACMEDVLATYERPFDPQEPVVCLDERPIQMLKNINSTSRMVQPNKPRKKDYEYKRKGTANAFCAIEPKRGKHFTRITKNRKAAQFAEFMREIGRAYPAAKTIHIVMDNLNTHTEKSLINNLGPKRGSNLWKRLQGSLHAKTRQLAQSGRDGDQHVLTRMPGQRQDCMYRNAN